MKKIIVLALFLLLFSQTAMAADLNACKDDNGFGGIGNCILRESFGGDAVFFSIIMLLLIGVFLWQTQAPAGSSIPIFLIMVFALMPFLGNFGSMMLNLIVLVIGLMIGLAILKYIKR